MLSTEPCESTEEVVAKAIDQVRQTLDRWGWIQESYEAEDGFCLVGAIEKVFSVSLRNPDDFVLLPVILDPPRLVALEKVLTRLCREVDADLAGPLHPFFAYQLVAFNDDASTSYEDLVLVLKRAQVASTCSADQGTGPSESARHREARLAPRHA
jgi:hypothetical protein